jgi:hypothetical protein
VPFGGLTVLHGIFIESCKPCFQIITLFSLIIIEETDFRRMSIFFLDVQARSKARHDQQLKLKLLAERQRVLGRLTFGGCQPSLVR